MFSLVFWGAVITLTVGVIAKFVLDRKQSLYRITGIEYSIAALVMVLIVIPATSYFGIQAAKMNQLTFNENWGGFEINAKLIKTQCERDGWNVKHSYKGDPYQYVWYTDITDKDGKVIGQERHEETRYHDIPYCSEEWTFVIETTLGDFTIADRNLPPNPNKYRYRAWVSVPDNLPSGIPEFWSNAKARIERGDNGPVTVRKSYTNYILASQSTILRRFNDSIDDYKTKNLLPEINSKIHDFYYSNRVYFVGVGTMPSWQTALNRFNGALGASLEGDLHIVIVDAAKIPNPDNYAGAVIAYWQSVEFGKDALSKNGILLILGTRDKKTIEWSRAYTGMPLGNEALLLELRNKLPKCNLDPETLLGHPQAIIIGNQVKVRSSKSILEKIFWGANTFKRIHMGDHEGEAPGFGFLMHELQPTTGQKVGILLIVTLFSGVAWGACIGFGTPRLHRNRFH
jgi:hypothetical protein